MALASVGKELIVGVREFVCDSNCRKFLFLFFVFAFFVVTQKVALLLALYYNLPI